LLKFLGSGSFGEVWQAEERTTFSVNEFALKFVRAKGDQGIDLEAVRHEIGLWKQASGHPNVIPFIKADLYGEELVIVSEYADGGSMKGWLAQHGGQAPSLAEAARMARGILRGLEHLHGKGVLHRDLKPDNVLLQGGVPRLTDFGVSGVLTTRTDTKTLTGTLRYMPPEAFQKKKSEHTDIWAVGILLYQMLTGRVPFDAPDDAAVMYQILMEEPPSLPASVPPAVQAVVLKALSKDRAQRYPTAAAMREDLEKALRTPDRLRPAGAALPSDAYREFAFTTPTVDDKGNVIQNRQLTARSFSERIAGVELEMVEIPGGDFLRGSTEADAKAAWEDAKRYNKDASWDWLISELPQRRVVVPPFFLSKGAVTQGQWRAVAKLPKVNADLNPEPSHFKGDDLLPADSVNWHEAQEFCARLTALTGRAYRLPSEAEWEYACRAGTTTPFAFGPTVTPALANYNGNYPYGQATKGDYREKTWPVFSGMPNAFGLYNMHGNLWEWCEDIWQDSYDDLPVDGSPNLNQGQKDGRVLRGGSWNFVARLCRSAVRSRDTPRLRYNSLGFRVAVASSK
jgi:formylglycine-generating enzyme required for sulfatase activity